MTCLRATLLLGSGALLTGCSLFHSPNGGAEAHFVGPRVVDVDDVAVPPGYHIEVVATGLTFPTGVTFDDAGRVYVVEAGYAYGEVWTTPRLLRVDPDKLTIIARGGDNRGPWNGVSFHEGVFYVAEGGVIEGGRILRIDGDGTIDPLVSGLPSFGDHHTNGPVVGPDGALYFGQGTATNSGVVGEDNARFGWLSRYPSFHDTPGEDIVLTGENFGTPRHEGDGDMLTGAFLPYGTPSTPGQVIRGEIPCSGSVMKLRLDGSPQGRLELVAWGFRNPYGLAFAPSGDLYVTDNGYDERGSRPLWGTADVLWQVEAGAWYGWPDFAAGREHHDAKPLLRDRQGTPPDPTAEFSVHCSANGLDISRSDVFGHCGQAFVALFGDEVPATGSLLHPSGFKVVRVDLDTGVIEDFATNRGEVNGPASWLAASGLERPIAVRFRPDGASLYIVDFGVLTHTDQGADPRPSTGVLWRIAPDGN